MLHGACNQQWNNPRPDVEITSVALVAAPDRRGVLALLAVTAALAGRQEEGT